VLIHAAGYDISQQGAIKIIADLDYGGGGFVAAGLYT